MSLWLKRHHYYLLLFEASYDKKSSGFQTRSYRAFFWGIQFFCTSTDLENASPQIFKSKFKICFNPLWVRKTSQNSNIFLNILLLLSRVYLYLKVNKTPFGANPSSLMTKLGQIWAHFGQVGQVSHLPTFFLKSSCGFDAYQFSNLKIEDWNIFWSLRTKKRPKEGIKWGFFK